MEIYKIRRNKFTELIELYRSPIIMGECIPAFGRQVTKGLHRIDMHLAVDNAFFQTG